MYTMEYIDNINVGISFDKQSTLLLSVVRFTFFAITSKCDFSKVPSDHFTTHEGSFLIVSFSGPKMATPHVL